MTTATTRRRGRLLSTLAVVGAGALLLSACSSGGSGNGSGSNFTYLGQTENTTIVGTLKTLSTGECTAENKALPLKATNSPGTSFDQKLQLLAGQDALPSMSMAAGTPSLMKQFIDAGKIKDLSTVSGVSDTILPAAKSTIEKLYDTDKLYVLPTEFNIEGFWYNKKIFSDNGIEVPKTWDALVDASVTLKAAGVQPISTDGKDGWPITRLIGDYIFRDLGPDALKEVADGKAKLTDADYVKAADAVSALGKQGFFGDAVGSVDYNTMVNSFLTGKAAMMYNGSWVLANFSDKTQNQIGEDNIGYMQFPAVSGGKGRIDEVPSNIGVPVTFASKGFDSKVGDWAKCIAGNYGNQVLADSGVVSGFTISKQPSDENTLTKTVQDVATNTTSSVLWFEALFSSKATSVSQQNAGQLANGSISGAQFMQLVQDAK